MTPASTNEKLDQNVGTRDADYLAWKLTKIETALRQAEDRDAMIPADEVWHRLDLER